MSSSVFPSVNVRIVQVPPTEYADQMPELRRFATLPAEDPQRAPLREQLILRFLPVVRHLARRHSGGNPAILDDLVQTGTVALITAVDRWDPQRARGEFLGYLIPCVRGEMLRWFRDRTWAVSVPRRLKDLTVSIGRIVDPLTEELGRPPRPSELAERLKRTTQDIVEALAARENRTADPLDADDRDSGSTSVDRYGDIDPALDLIECTQVLRPLLDALPARERTVLSLRFYGECTQIQIAQQLGVSQMQISRVLARTLQQLRAALTDDAGS